MVGEKLAFSNSVVPDFSVGRFPGAPLIIRDRLMRAWPH